MLYFYFSIKVFFHRHWLFTRQKGKWGGHFLFFSTSSTHLQTFRHLFTTLHVRWLPRIFNRTSCIYQTTTRSGLLPYWTTIRVIDDWMLMLVLLTRWFNSRVFVTAIWHWKLSNFSSHRLSPLYYTQTD